MSGMIGIRGRGRRRREKKIAVPAEFRRAGIKKATETRHFKRYRLRNPKKFRSGSFRTVDIGKKGHHQLIRGRTRRTGKFEIQAVIAEKGKTKKSETLKIIRRSKS